MLFSDECRIRVWWQRFHVVTMVIHHQGWIFLESSIFLFQTAWTLQIIYYLWETFLFSRKPFYVDTTAQRNVYGWWRPFGFLHNHQFIVWYPPKFHHLWFRSDDVDGSVPSSHVIRIFNDKTHIIKFLGAVAKSLSLISCLSDVFSLSVA